MVTFNGDVGLPKESIRVSLAISSAPRLPRDCWVLLTSQRYHTDRWAQSKHTNMSHDVKWCMYIYIYTYIYMYSICICTCICICVYVYVYMWYVSQYVHGLIHMWLIYTCTWKRYEMMWNLEALKWYDGSNHPHTGNVINYIYIYVYIQGFIQSAGTIYNNHQLHINYSTVHSPVFDVKTSIHDSYPDDDHPHSPSYWWFNLIRVLRCIVEKH